MLAASADVWAAACGELAIALAETLEMSRLLELGLVCNLGVAFHVGYIFASTTAGCGVSDIPLADGWNIRTAISSTATAHGGAYKVISIVKKIRSMFESLTSFLWELSLNAGPGGTTIDYVNCSTTVSSCDVLHVTVRRRDM